MIISQPKQHFQLTLFFLIITSSSSLFHITHARLGATPALSPHVPNEGANSTMLPMLLVVFVFAFFITGFCSLYIRYCSERYMVEQNDAVGKGTDPELLATCPIVVYSTVKTGQRHVALQCAVCLGEFRDIDKLRLLPKCSHVFHPGCIDTWLASHVTCPVCRAEISGEKGVRQVFVESSVRRVEGENGSGVCGNVDGFVGKGNGSSKVSAFGFGVLVRSHSTGHSLVEPGKSVERFIKKQIVEDKGGNLMVMKRSASYDVVLHIEEGRGEDGGGEGSSSRNKSNGFGFGSSGAREDKESQARTIFQVV